jgi:RNA polymerase sigma-70 factor (ECF subfamily)
MEAEALRGQLGATAPALLRYARMLTGDEHDAADLVQDTLVRGLQHAEQFDGRASVTTWLRRIMHNLWVDRARSRREEPSDAVAELVESWWRADDYTVDAAVVVERAETRDLLREALTHLPTMYRTAVALHDGEGLTVAEVAEITGVSLPAAKQRLRRGRMMLVSALDDGPPPPQPGVPMRCWQARSQVSDYLDGALPPGKARSVEAHLAGCRTCPPLYAALVGTREALAGSTAHQDPDSVVPDDLAWRIRELLDAQA